MAKTITLEHGTPTFARLLARLAATPGLPEVMWDHAEGEFAELDRPGTLWSVALAGDGEAGAWCAARPEDGHLKCFLNYERPRYRGLGFYEAAYAERHRVAVEPSGLVAVTYLFPEPVALHRRDGWRPTGVQGVSWATGKAHAWQELRREPTA